MAETFTLAHFTDVHLSPVVGFTPRYWNIKRCLGFLNWQVKRRGVHQRATSDALIRDAKTLGADHIVITGDLVNLGLPREYESARDWLKMVGSAETVTVVPGNHDIYSALHGDPGCARWAPYMGSEADTHAFPFVRRVGPIALVGLNSAVETPPFVASGRLGGEQIDVARDLLQRLHDEDVIRVVLIHHPPLPGMASPKRALSDAAHLRRALSKSGAELVLYGHNHRPTFDWLETDTGPLAIVGGASASASRSYKGEPLAQYSLFTFFDTGDRLRIRHIVRGIDGPGGKIVKLGERVLEPSAFA